MQPDLKYNLSNKEVYRDDLETVFARLNEATEGKSSDAALHRAGQAAIIGLRREGKVRQEICDIIAQFLIYGGIPSYIGRISLMLRAYPLIREGVERALIQRLLACQVRKCLGCNSWNIRY